MDIVQITRRNRDLLELFKGEIRAKDPLDVPKHGSSASSWCFRCLDNGVWKVRVGAGWMNAPTRSGDARNPFPK